MEGSVISVRAKDFMTFNILEYIPEKSLNFIIGPNGSGKSSIFCALVLGLGGKTTIIKRADKISNFIKYGCQKSTIDIELANPNGDNYLIRREINRDNSSQWFLNGRRVKTVENITNSLNIQLNNLCQFLPQDRVSDFAKMKQVELLENTEKAVTPELFDSHKLLNEKTRGIQKNKKDLQTLINNLENERQKVAQLQEKVNNYLEKERHMEQVRTIEKKRKFLSYQKYKREANGINKIVQDIKDKKGKLEKDKAPFVDKINKIRVEIKNSEIKSKNWQSKLGQLQKEIMDKTERIESNTSKVNDIHHELENKKKEEASRLQKINEGQLMLTEKLASSAEVQKKRPLVEQNILKKNQEINHLTENISELKSRLLNYDQEIKNIEDEKKRENANLSQLFNRERSKLEFLGSKNKDAYEAVNWLRENKHLFSKTIHEPMVLLIEPMNLKNAKYIESIVSFNDMFSFVFEDSNDLNTFMSILHDKKRLKLNCVMAPEKSLASFKPRVPLQSLGPLGYHSYIVDLFKAPEPVMAYLCNQYNIHNIPLGQQNAETEKMFNLGFRKLYTENIMHSAKLSRYGNHQRSVLSTEIREASLLRESISQEQVKNLQDQISNFQLTIDNLANMKNQLLTELNSVKIKWNAQIAEKNDLKGELEEIKGTLLIVRQLANQLERLKMQQLNMDAEMEKSEGKLKTIYESHLTLIQSLNSRIMQSFTATKELTRLECYLLFLKRKRVIADEDVKHLMMQEKEMDENLTKETQSLNEKLREIRQFVNETRELTGFDLKEALTPDYKIQFSKLSNKMPDLEKLLFEEQAKGECFEETDEESVQEFKHHKKKISEIETEIQILENKMSDIQEEIDDIQNRWLPPLEQLVGRINSNFHKFMSLLGCSGEVSLNKGQDPSDFTSYGICIRVKFRANEELMELTSSYQSGGERSVSTIVYMMALQELTKVPFRCLDEINQGMDPVNERRVYELVGKISEQNNCSQYFLITPKLLPGQKFADSTTITILYPSQYSCSFGPSSELDFVSQQ